MAVATATLAALAVTGTAAAAADTGPAATKSGSAVIKTDDKAKAGDKAEDRSKDKDRSGKSPDFAAVAAKLGVTLDRLDAALIAAKTALADSPDATPEAFIAAVATALGLPTAQVSDALGPLLVETAHGGDKNGKKDDKHHQGKDGDDPQQSPLTTDAAAASFAAILGVDQAEAKAALAAIVTLGATGHGIDPDSAGFGRIAASLGVTTDQLRAGLSALKQSLDQH